jgi:hypothetical protein
VAGSSAVLGRLPFVIPWRPHRLHAPPQGHNRWYRWTALGRGLGGASGRMLAR